MTTKQRIEEVANTFRNYVEKGDKASKMLIETFTRKEIGFALVLYLKDHEMDYWKAMEKQRDKLEKLENENLVRENADKRLIKIKTFFLFGFYLSLPMTAHDNLFMTDPFFNTILILFFTIVALGCLLVVLFLHKSSSIQTISQTEIFCFHLGWGLIAYCFLRIGLADMSPQFFPWGPNGSSASREKILPLVYFFIPGIIFLSYYFIIKSGRKGRD